MQRTMPYDERNEETGQFDQAYSAEDFIEAIEEQPRNATTSQVSEKVGCAYRTAHSRLSELEQEGQVTSEKLGSMLLWSVPEDDDNESDN